jgi:hypothetical protein
MSACGHMPKQCQLMLLRMQGWLFARLSGLQVPEADRAVLRAGHNALHQRVGHQERGKDAVLPILVACIARGKWAVSFIAQLRTAVLALCQATDVLLACMQC